MATKRTASYLVRMTPEQRMELRALADHKGVSLNTAFVEGAYGYLANSEPEPGPDDLAAQLRTVAAKVERQLRR